MAPQPLGACVVEDPVYELAEPGPVRATRMWGDVKTVDKGTDLRDCFGPVVAGFATIDTVRKSRICAV